MHDLVVHRECERAAEKAIHQRHQFSLVVALDVRGLAVFPLVWIGMDARGADDDDTIGPAQPRQASDELPALLDRKVLDDVERNDRIVALARVVVEYRLQSKLDIVASIDAARCLVVARIDLEAGYVL